MSEIWKPVVDYEGQYKVSSLGRVFSMKSNRLMKLGTDTRGYLFAHLSNCNISKTPSVHKLVAKAFLDHRIGDGFVVDHINGEKRDNRVENLQLITQRENTIKGKLSTLREGKLSKYPGVTFVKDKRKWKAQIRIEGKNKHLGYFTEEELAFEAYKECLNSI